MEGFHGRRGRLPLALREATSAPAFSGGGVAGSGREGRLAVSETAPERRAGSSASRRRVAERREASWADETPLPLPASSAAPNRGRIRLRRPRRLPVSEPAARAPVVESGATTLVPESAARASVMESAARAPGAPVAESVATTPVVESPVVVEWGARISPMRTDREQGFPFPWRRGALGEEVWGIFSRRCALGPEWGRRI